MLDAPVVNSLLASFSSCRNMPKCLKLRESTREARVSGITLIELLVVLAVLGIVIGIAVFSNRDALTGQQEQAAIRSIQQSVWQGASAASARGRNTELIHVGRQIEVREVGNGNLIRSEELPAGISTSLPNLVFTPPGKISEASFSEVADGITVVSSSGTTLLRVSIIGEVVAVRQ